MSATTSPTPATPHPTGGPGGSPATPHATSTAEGAAGGSASFRERMHPAAWWWLVALVLWLSVTIAVWAYLDWGWALGATLAVALLSGAWILQFGMVVRADETGLRVGRNRIDWCWVASARPLDARETTAYLESPAHHAVFLAVRPYVRTSVLLTLADPADPHPAWIVSTRHPQRLADLANDCIARAGRR